MNMFKAILAVVALSFSLNSFALTDEEYLALTDAISTGNTKVVKKFMDADPRLDIIIGFVATFLLVMVAIQLIGKGFEKILETAHINFINKLAGGLLSGLITLIIFSSIISFMDGLKFG